MKAIKIIILALCVVIPASICLAEDTYIVEGYVYEKATGRPIEGAHMQWYWGSERDDTPDTDENGFYQFTANVQEFGYPPYMPHGGLRVIAVVNYGEPSPVYISDINITSLPIEGHVFRRDIYIDIPREYSDDIHYEILEAINGTSHAAALEAIDNVNANIASTQSMLTRYKKKIMIQLWMNARAINAINEIIQNISEKVTSLFTGN